jgi:hypothetical protein
MAITFADVQDMLDAVLAKSTWAQGEMPPLNPQPHGAFWRQTGNYDQDYTAFTTGDVPNIGIPIMNTTPGQELQSNFFVILTNPNGLPNDGIPQMPGGPGGPFITDSGYQVDVKGTTMTGQQIQNALAGWLTGGFPK